MTDILCVPAGTATVRQIQLAYRANLPVMLHGPHGVGKSELIHQAAKELGVRAIVRDLSLLEPPDLVGIPQVRGDGRTDYALPSFLPRDGAGLLVFEELNRAPRYMLAPCLQLLTARRLNDYVLPDGWLPCAAVNDAEDGYAVEELDAALLSRFVRFKIKADRSSWCEWASVAGIAESVIDFVEKSPNIFDDPDSNPRAWTHVSRLLRAAELSHATPEELAIAIAGVVGETWCGAFTTFTFQKAKPLKAEQILHHFSRHLSLLRNWKRAKRVDLLEATWTDLKNYLQKQANFDRLLETPNSKRNVELFINDLVPDVRRRAIGWLSKQGLEGLALRTPRSP